MTGPAGPRVVDCRSAAILIKSALRDLLSVSYGMISILVISRYAAPPYPAAPDFHLKVKRLTMICASLALLQIMFAVHPRESVSHDSQVALLPYESCSLATPMQGAEQPMLSVEQLMKRWNREALLCPRLRGKGGGASHQRGIVFPTPAGRL